MTHELNSGQIAALEALQRTDNVFLTGAAGSGKSFVLKKYLAVRPEGYRVPVLASTGAAAILVGGRTFHSFFGLGIMEGGARKTIERALLNKRLAKRLRKTHEVIIDEVSMISGPQLSAAEAIARQTRDSSTPWGGMRIIAVGDFAQLPPVNPFSDSKEWAFLDDVWARSAFEPVVLRQVMRASDPEYLAVLNDVREGRVTERARGFLNTRSSAAPRGDFTCLFPRRDAVERHNLQRLASLRHPLHSFETVYEGKAKDIEAFRKHSPLTDVISLKKDALVMLRQNDPEGRWVNGSLGHVKKVSEDLLSIELLRNRETVEVEHAAFTLLNADGNPVVTARNFPVSLAWAITIHKAQGATLDSIRVDLKRAWEPGQAYVALSRARNPDGLFIDGWNASSILADPLVTSFHRALTARG
ncbi:MAG: AAA family ATPase [Deltaproteobacteria bacterium]|nr:AAA family ATPase [Deltaproteobacteria bacterium]